MFWLDDAHQHLGAGLYEHNLERLGRRFPGCALALAFTTGTTEQPRQLWPALDLVPLDAHLTADEIEAACADYRGFTFDELRLLPERLAGVERLWGTYQDIADKRPTG